MMTEEQQKLVAFLEEKIGSLRFAVKQNAFEKILPELKHELDCAEIALAALTQPASQSENIRQDALCDTNYARGVSHGWNLAQNGDSEGMRKCIESRTTAAMSVLAQPVSPALRLPNKMDIDGRNLRGDSIHNVFARGEQSGFNRCLDEVKRLNAPHTVPIEPTGGAVWVKVRDKMPLELSDEHMSEIEVIVTDGKTVGTCECRRGYMPCPWVEWSNYGDIDAEKITHWMPLPAAPKL